MGKRVRPSCSISAVARPTSAADGPSWPNGCRVCEFERDPATGQVQVIACASMNAVGRVVNPTIVRGQLDGGVAQGLAQALGETVVHDPDSAQLLTGSLMDDARARAGQPELCSRLQRLLTPARMWELLRG